MAKRVAQRRAMRSENPTARRAARAIRLKYLPLRRGGKWDPTGAVRKVTSGKSGAYVVRETAKRGRPLYVGASFMADGEGGRQTRQARPDRPERFYRTIQRHFHATKSFERRKEWVSDTTHDLDVAIVVTKPADAYAVEGQLIVQVDPVGNRERPEASDDGDDSFDVASLERRDNPGKLRGWTFEYIGDVTAPKLALALYHYTGDRAFEKLHQARATWAQIEAAAARDGITIARKPGARTTGAARYSWVRPRVENPAPSKKSDAKALRFRKGWTGREPAEFLEATPDNPGAQVAAFLRVHRIGYREAKRGRGREIHDHKFSKPYPVLCLPVTPATPVKLRVSSDDVPKPREDRTLVALGELVDFHGEEIATGKVDRWAWPRGIRVVGDPVTREALFLRLTPRARQKAGPLFMKRAGSPYTLTHRGFER